MTDHKFDPFEKVLVRQTGADRWRARFYETQYADHDGQHTRYETTDNGYWWECIPYTPETAHLIGTSQPYEPPKPPQEYEWGQKVKVLIGREWDKGLYIGCIPISLKHRVYTNKHGDRLFSYTEIHPLTDTAAH